jgi:putative tricarboxylic transport membrane protein
MRRTTKLALAATLLCLLTACASPAGGGELRIMVPNSPGGGYDVTARTAVKITEMTGITGSVPVFNLTGAGGTLALTRLMHETGNPDLLMMMGLGIVGATITDPDSARVTEATPIARLIEEPEGVMVRADSPYRTIDELTAAWRAAPGGLAVGGGSLRGGPDYLLTMRIAAAVGVAPPDVDYVSHDGGGELLPALLSGGIDAAASGVREYTEQIRSGQIRVLAVSGASRLGGLEAPTLTESGIDVVFANWRGVIAPPGISDEDRQRLIDVFADLTTTPEWQTELADNGWTDALLTGDDFAAFLAEQDRDVESQLRELGLS